MGSGARQALFTLAAGAGAALARQRLRARRNSFDFRDRVVLITGGSRGLGLVMARQLADEGARLALCARDELELRRAHDELVARGAAVLAIPCDIREQAQVDRMVREVVQHYGRLDVVINNAGVIVVGPLEHMTTDDFEDAMATNFWAPLYLTMAARPHMRMQRGGRIVNISSIGGKVSIPHLLPYSASKFALVGLSEGLRAELSRDGIVVVTVCPGLMRTGSPPNAWFKGRNAEEHAWFTVSDSLPLTAMSAERAARQVLSACRRGDAEVVLSIQARLLALAHALAPGLTADVMGLVNRLLPEPGGLGETRVRGRESRSPSLPTWLTWLGDRAAERNNEVIPPASG